MKNSPKINHENGKSDHASQCPSVSALSVFVETYICYLLLKDTGYDISNVYYGVKTSLPNNYQNRLFRLEQQTSNGYHWLNRYSGLARIRQIARNKMPKLSRRQNIGVNIGLIALLSYHQWKQKKQVDCDQNNLHLMLSNEKAKDKIVDNHIETTHTP